MAERESICLRCFHSYACEQFNEHRDLKNDKCHFYNDHFVPYADVVPVQKWISVKDRLPEPEQEVILCTREIETYGRHNEKKKIYRNIYMGYFDGYEWLTFYCHGCEYIFRMNEKFKNETIEVTHWMPSPEPPKEE